MVSTKLVPPNGGYGWFVACAFSIHHMIVVPLGHSFGLVFKDKFKELGFSATDITFIINTNAACSFWCGILNGALLKCLGYRKVAMAGALLMTIGVFATAFAETLAQYILIYGILTAIGMGMGISSYPLALSTYFTTKRSKAFGYAMTVSGGGAVLLPQLVSFLLSVYSETGTVIILSGIAAHAFISASLLQPIERHLKKEIIPEDANKIETGALLTDDDVENVDTPEKKQSDSIPSLIDVDIYNSTYNIDSSLRNSVLSVNSDFRQRSISFSSENGSVKSPQLHRKLSTNFVGHDKKHEVKEKVKTNDDPVNSVAINGTISHQQQVSFLGKCVKFIVHLFDLTLLKDFTFINIIVSISLGVCAEKSFTLLTAFIMQDYGLNTQQIATFMSMLSITDICFRFIAPYVSDFFKKPVRVMYVWAVLLQVIFRCGLLVTNNYVALLVCAVLIGFARGFRTIYWMLVMPSYVPIERLASASGLQSILNGIVIWAAGPLLGFIKDVTGSFKMCVLVLNLMAFISILMWVVEFAYKACKAKREKIKNTQKQDSVADGVNDSV